MAVSRIPSLAGRVTSAIEQFMATPTAELLASPVSSRPVRSSPAVPAVLMRAGTSRGIFLHARHLPKSKDTWPGIISAIMGSHNGDRRQLDGVGGATSTTSKAAIIAPSSRPDADVDYTFAQVVVGENRVDMSGSCGNICSGVGPFALDERLVTPRRKKDDAIVRVHDTNTGAIIEQTLAVDKAGRYNPNGTHRISGYSGTGSPLQMAWLNPAGTVGPRKFYPSGKASEYITVSVPDFPDQISARVSLIDAANPFVFVDATSLPQTVLDVGHADAKFLSLIEAIRCEASVRMGIAATPEEAHTLRPIPKIALLYPPGPDTDIRVVPYSLGKPHPSCQLTGTIALSAALSYPGTVASTLAREARGLPQLEDVETGGVRKRIQHPGGVNEAEVFNEGDKVEKVSVLTTAQPLFRGEAYVPKL